jgi:hypothetical protein
MLASIITTVKPRLARVHVEKLVTAISRMETKMPKNWACARPA